MGDRKPAATVTETAGVDTVLLQTAGYCHQDLGARYRRQTIPVPDGGDVYGREPPGNVGEHACR